MKNFKFVILLLVVFLSTACDSKERNRMPTAQNMKTYCIGRQLFDVPAAFYPTNPLTGVFRQSSHNRKTSTISVNLLAQSVASLDFARTVEKRRVEIVAATRDKRNVLEAVITPEKNAALFRISRIEDSYMSEAHILRGSIYFTAEARSYSGLFEIAETDIFDFVSKIGLADAAAVSPQVGYCLGPLVVGGEYETESVVIAFRNDQQPDMLLTISVDTYNRDDPVTLLQRVSGPNSLLEQVDVRPTVLRKRQFDVIGMNAQEWLGSVRLGENRDKKQLGFAFETRRAKPGPGAPRIHIELDTGKQDRNGVERPNSLSDEAAIALWDSIVSSIRPKQKATDSD